MLEDGPQITNGVQLSIVQGYMSKFYRSVPLPVFDFCLRRVVFDVVFTCLSSGDMEHGLLDIQSSSCVRPWQLFFYCV